MVLTLEEWEILKKPPSDPQLSLVIPGESPSMQSCTYPELKLQQALPGHRETGWFLVLGTGRDKETSGQLCPLQPCPPLWTPHPFLILLLWSQRHTGEQASRPSPY